MRWIGVALFLAGIGLAGTYGARPVEVASDGEATEPTARIVAWWDAAGLEFSLGIIYMIAGAVIVRRRSRRSAGPDGKREGGVESAADLIETIRDRLEALPDDPRAGSALIQAKLDEILEDLVPQFLDQREILISRMGLGTFAEMIGHFARMERNAARAWSSLIDEAYGEVPACLERAREGATRALETLRAGSAEEHARAV